MTIPPHIQQAIQAYYAERATDDDIVALESWLREDEAHVRLFAELGMVEWQMLCELEKADTAAVLSMLREAEDNAIPDYSLLHTPASDTEPATTDPPPITAREFFSLAGYLAGKGLRTRAGVIGSVAAVLVLGLVLYLELVGLPATPAPQPHAGNTPTRRDAQPLPTPVATLTQTHDAQWAAFKLSAGDALYARQRLTLTQGFAEITTDSGAVAILEAPATIELTDSDNALRLHDGRLVGICESESSKGFTVYTPTARIIDLGTRFGTVVGKDKSTRTAVFDGEVELTARNGLSDQPARSIRLTAGWSSGVSTRGVLDREPEPLNARDHNRFAHRIEDGMNPRFAYRRAVLSADPLVYWSFDEADEQTSNLAGSDAFDGRAMGQPNYAKGLFGSAVRLTGDIKSMGGFASKSPLDFNEVSAYTLEAWCWIDRPHYGRVVALAELDPDQTQPPMHLSMVEVIGGDMLSNIARPHRDSVRFLHRNPPSFESEEGSNWFTDQAPPVGQWFHMVVVKDEQEARIYIDGALALRSKDTQPTATESPVSLFVGVSPIMLRSELSSSPRDFRPFHGLIDEVAVYDTALAAQTIQHHFSLGRPSEGG